MSSLLRLVPAAAVIALLSACSPGHATFQPIEEAVLAAAKPYAHCAFAAVEGVRAGPTAKVKRSTPANLSGWVTDDKKQAPGEFSIILRGPKSYAAAIELGVDRPDVAKALGSPAAAKSGYSRYVDFGSVPAGTYQLAALVKTDAGQGICALNHALVLVD